jgi:hypothetical protein
MSKVRFVGLDVHAETVAVAVAESGDEVRSLAVIPNHYDSVRKLVGRLGPVASDASDGSLSAQEECPICFRASHR